eukprot:evm.model.scf_1736.1 EVM.evm.TU.scf_1736.1   scf_1736:1998-6192(+)
MRWRAVAQAFLALATAAAVSGNGGNDVPIDGEPAGKVSIVEAVVRQSLLAGGGDSEMGEFHLACQSGSRGTYVHLTQIKSLGKKVAFPDGSGFLFELLTFEAITCELKESSASSDAMVSHGSCEMSYRSFLVAEDKSAVCSLQEHGMFKLRMECRDGCPDLNPQQNGAFCNGTMTLPAGNQSGKKDFGDGSPGYEMYAPNTACTWRIPNPDGSRTTFVFTRFDLANGDHISIYESANGDTANRIKLFNEVTAPTSISTSAPFMLVEFSSDGDQEGLGFHGYYYSDKDECIGSKPQNCTQANRVGQFVVSDVAQVANETPARV